MCLIHFGGLDDFWWKKLCVFVFYSGNKCEFIYNNKYFCLKFKVMIIRYIKSYQQGC